MASSPNRNLWAVKYTVDGVSPTEHSHLWILAASAETAAKKARTHLRRQGEKRIRIEGVEWKGTIDAW
jgi:hypothetical protein